MTSSSPSPTDLKWMRVALNLAKRGLGNVAPNPAVGCVIIRHDEAGREIVVGRGNTQPSGRPHAERVALDMAGNKAKAATAYVTLEPCAHYGKTPPCALGLIEAGVSRVVIATGDPDPRVAGRGINMLQKAGIEVLSGVMRNEARALNAGFLLRHENGRPFVQLKLATTLDGRIATAFGESKWITGPAARRLVHLQRSEADAIMVGAATLRADDPSLDVRLSGLEAASPRPVIISSNLDLDPNSRLISNAANNGLIICHSASTAAQTSKWADEDVTLIDVPADQQGRPQMRACLEALAAQGVTRIYCEGGASLAASLLRADLIDEIIWFTAGLALGASGYPALADLDIDKLARARRFTLKSQAQIGPDLMSIWSR